MTEAALHQWLADPLPAGVEEILTRLRRTAGVVHVAVMPDVHRAAEFCVGTVVASDRYLFPNAVGGDIGCGMFALQFDHPMPASELLADPGKAAKLLGLLERACPGRRHHRTRIPDLAEEFRTPLSHPALAAQRNAEACRAQLGTLGGGNHFLEIQSDDAGHLWLMLHTGSRNLGQVIHRHHLRYAQRLPTNLLAILADSPEGRAYLADVQAARAWAAFNRRHLALAAVQAIEQTFGATPLLNTLIDCDHNHLSPETHRGQLLFIHRKGATSANARQPGLIPGSMATHSYHTLGRGTAESLCSSSHGAGRTLSRSEARQRITRKALRAQLTRAGVWYDTRIESTLIEESPAAYKPIDAVMAAQADLTTVTRRLRPLLIYKGKD
jgi:tRNA-splicing ligase RtcB (3'-phosphate/5'-hydroxy nucleic acid ligase)